MTINKPEIKVAILDLYDGMANEGMRGFQDILNRYKAQHNLNLTYKIFEVRRNCEVPGLDFDIYISSGGPGSPLDTEGTEWEKKYFRLTDRLEDHNLSASANKKHALFVCHSFQLMCRKYDLGEINMRRSPSFGVLPVNKTQDGATEHLFEGLDDPFYAVDSRSWQVINPNQARLKALDMQLVAIEKARPHIDLPRAMMAVRYNEYFFGTQFHPEADAAGIKSMLLREEKKEEVINEHGEVKYIEMLQRLDDPDKITHTQHTLIPNFLNQALMTLGVV